MSSPQRTPKRGRKDTHHRIRVYITVDVDDLLQRSSYHCCLGLARGPICKEN